MAALVHLRCQEHGPKDECRWRGIWPLIQRRLTIHHRIQSPKHLCVRERDEYGFRGKMTFHICPSYVDIFHGFHFFFQYKSIFHEF